ncbi:MAG: alpha/beta hydrolase family protein [Pyrinomonadaceae bacterium]
MKKGFLLLVLLIAVSSTANLQTISGLPVQAPRIDSLFPRFESRELDSKLMGRKMPYRVVFPSGYSSRNETPPFPVVYLLHGLTGHHTNWIDKTKLVDSASKHNFIIVTPEGDNGWYTDSVSTPNDRYESYIIKELIPEIDKTFRTAADRDHRMIAGLSMGGYGSLKFGMKYPEMFSLIGSFSGALGAASFSEKNAGLIGKGIDAIYGPDDSDTRKANDIFKLVRDLTADRQKSLPFIYQSCGTEDFLIQNNRDFLSLLNEKKIPHEYREHPGIHDWVFWDDQVREFLDLADRRVKK